MIQHNYIYIMKPPKWTFAGNIPHMYIETFVCRYSPYCSAVKCLLEFTTSFALCSSCFTFYMLQKVCFTGYCIPHYFAQGNRINELVIMTLYVALVLLMKGSCTWNRTEPQGGYRAVTETYIYYNNTKQTIVELSVQCL